MSGVRAVLWTVYYAKIPIPTLRDKPLRSYCEELSIDKYVNLGPMPNKALCDHTAPSYDRGLTAEPPDIAII
ncbi:hypothetical protein [Nostoc sp.]